MMRLFVGFYDTQTLDNPKSSSFTRFYLPLALLQPFAQCKNFGRMQRGKNTAKIMWLEVREGRKTCARGTRAHTNTKSLFLPPSVYKKTKVRNSFLCLKKEIQAKLFQWMF